jgi:hypothetical protein
LARYHGKTAAIYIGTTISGVATKVTAMTEWSLDGSTERVDVTSFEDANIVRVNGLPDRKGTFSGHWDDTDSKLFTAAGVAGGVKMYLYPDVVNAPTKYFYGQANIDFSMSAGVKDAVKVSGNFDAAGSWGHTFV